MKLGEIIDIISFRLGNRTGLDTEIIRETKTLQTTLERSGDDLPWFLEVSNFSLVVPAAQNVALPSNFLRPIAVFKGKTRYDKVDRDDLRLEDLKGCPAYAVFAGKLWLPDEDTDSVTLILDYYKTDTILEDRDSSNGWTTNFPDILISEVGYRIAKFVRDPEAIQLFLTDRAEARARFNKEIVAREESANFRELNKNA